LTKGTTYQNCCLQKHFVEDKTVEETAKETYHSPQDVLRYTNDIKMVRECLKEGWSIQRIAYTIGLSKSLTKEYAEMINGKEIPF